MKEEDDLEINDYEVKNKQIFRNKYKIYMKNDFIDKFGNINEKNIQLHKELFIDNPIQFCII